MWGGRLAVAALPYAAWRATALVVTIRLQHTEAQRLSTHLGGKGRLLPMSAEKLSCTSAGQDQSFRSRALRHLDCFVGFIERPAQEGATFVKNALAIAVPLTVSMLQLIWSAYLTVMHAWLRRFLRLAVGTPFLFGTIYLLVMAYCYFPEPPRMLNTSSVAGLGEVHTVSALVRHTLRIRSRYHAMLDTRRKERSPEGGSQQERAYAATSEVLTSAEENELLRGVLLVIRSIEECLMGTDEERALVEPMESLVLQSTPTSSSSTKSDHQYSRRVCAAEFVLRVVLSIALEQGWSDIAEHTCVLFGKLVRSSPVPQQACIARAVGDLCALSYELDHCTGGEVSVDQRRRVANAIDVFRPERAVIERCTIPSEIRVLPLPDSFNTTRCLSMIRHSPGRKPQLVMCFIGTNTNRNWLTNFNFFTTSLPDSFGVTGGASVHKGFYNLVQSIPYKEVAKDFDEIILVGHSLGGALAQLAGLELAAERPSRRILTVTTASPRVLAVDRAAYKQFKADAAGTPPIEGESALVAALRLPPNFRSFRMLLQPDAVPKLPPVWLNYCHVGMSMPLCTDCTTATSFIGWGMWSGLFHNADMYSRVLKSPFVTQTHAYTPTYDEEKQRTVLGAAGAMLHASFANFSTL